VIVMADKSELRISGPVLFSCAAFVVIVAGLRAAQPIVVPFIVATFVAMICLPALKWLQEKGLPTWLAFAAIATIIVLFGLAVVGVIGTSISQMREQLPEYQKRLTDLEGECTDWLKTKGIDITPQLEQVSFDPHRAVALFGDMLSALGSVLSDGLVIIFTLLFMVLEAAELPGKLRAISGGDNSLAERLEKIQASVRRYISIKTQLSVLNAVLVSCWLWWLDIDFVVLWGMLAFLLNYIPNIGAIIAAIPPVVLALLQFGVPTALFAAGGYLIIETIVGNVIEPRLMGRGLGLSPLVVFVSLIFWGWVLGPVGMLFSVPLTMVVKIVLDHSEDMQWLGILLSAQAPESAVKQSRR
jgi:AI-2 transport protein TqsA